MTPEQVDSVKKLASEGFAQRVIAERLGLTRDKVREALGRPKRQERRRAAKKRTSERERALMAEKGREYAPDATDDDLIEDLRRVQDLHPYRWITEQLYMLEGKYSFSTYTEHFGNFLEFRRQAALQLNRDQHALQRHIAKHASLDIYRDFMGEKVMPWVEQFPDTADNKRGSLKIIITGSDFHDLEADLFTLSVFLDTCYRLQPDVINLNGDVFDCYEFSKYEIDPRFANIVARFKFVHERIFKPLRELCPKARIDFNLGNHEWRLLKLLANANPYLKVVLSDLMGLKLEDIFGVKEFGINLICKWDLAAFKPQDIKNQVNKNFVVYYDKAYAVAHIANYGFGCSGTSGHTHKPQMPKPEVNLHGKHTWITTGCIAVAEMGYEEGLNRCMNGFNIAIVDENTKEVVQKPVLIPGHFTLVEGKVYDRTSMSEAWERVLN